MSATSGNWFDRAWRGLLLGLMTLFVINIGLMIAAVAVSSFAKRWLGTWLPEGWTTTWYSAAWKEFHDTFLSFGSPPVPLVRKMMMGEVGDAL